MIECLMGLQDDMIAALERELSNEIEISDSAKGNLMRRWASCRAMANSGVYAQSPEFISGMGGYAIPLYLPKRNRAVNNTASTLLDRDPMVQCLDISQQGKNDTGIEAALQTLMDDAGLSGLLKVAIREAFDSNLGHLRLRPRRGDTGKVEGLDLDMIFPEDIIAYPVYIHDTQKLKLIGWSRNEPYYEIKALQVKGVFRDIPLTTGSENGSNSDNSFSDRVRGNEFQATNKLDEAIEIDELIWDASIEHILNPNSEEPIDTKSYLIQFAKASGKILRIDPYGAVSQGLGVPDYVPYKKKWIVPVRLSVDGRHYYPEHSVASTMQEIQNLYSRIFTIVEQGSEMAASGVLLVSGGSIGASFKKFTPGMIIDNLPPGIKAELIQWNFNPGLFIQVLELLSGICDSVTGVGQLGTSEALPSGTTATEVDVLAQAMQESKDEYVDAIAPTVEGLYNLAFEYLKIYYDDLKDAFGDEITCSKEDVYNATLKFKVTGTSQASSPGRQLQKIQLVMSLVQQFPRLLNGTKVVEQLLQELDLPFSIETIMYTPEEQQHMFALAQASIPDMGGGPNNDGSVPGGDPANAGNPGMASLPSAGQPPAGNDGSGPTGLQ